MEFESDEIKRAKSIYEMVGVAKAYARGITDLMDLTIFTEHVQKIGDEFVNKYRKAPEPIATEQPPDPLPAAEPVRYEAKDGLLWRRLEGDGNCERGKLIATLYDPGARAMAERMADFLNLPTVRELARLVREEEQCRRDYYAHEHRLVTSVEGDWAQKPLTAWSNALAALESALVLVEGTP